MELLEFYPTPKELLDKITEGMKLSKIKTVLEPSAGKGDIVEYLLKKEDVDDRYGRWFSGRHLSIDCIEINPDLQKILKGKDFRVVHDDFLTYDTYKQYDLIIMNPPFSNADEHLAKAIELQERNGGAIICILNAQTIKNPYSYKRKKLVEKLNEAGADITFMQSEFTSAERTTDVEIAVVKVEFQAKQQKSLIIEELESKHYAEKDYEATDLATNDLIDAIIASYKYEIEAGIKLINEYKELQARMTQNIKNEKAILTLTTDGNSCSINTFVESTRMKYWRALFSDSRITGRMTAEQQKKYLAKVEELKDYEFSKHNILTMQIDMTNNLVSGIEDCIIKLFDELTYKYHWDEYSNNRHYFDGWKTNEAWIVNKKVILPFYGFSRYDNRLDTYHVIEKISDMEKAFRYLDTDKTMPVDVISTVRTANETGVTKNIYFTYFDCTFYKKGTCHITFRYPELLKKFNIFGAQHKGWLPPSYGKKRYKDMDKEEQAVVNSFEGEESYNETMNKADYYIVNTSSLALIDSAA